MRGKNRSRSTISQLPPEVRDVVEEMVQATNTCTLADIQKYLASLDVTPVSYTHLDVYKRQVRWTATRTRTVRKSGFGRML